MGLMERRRREKAEAEARGRLTAFGRLRDTEQLRTAGPQLRAALDRATQDLGETDPRTLQLWGLYGLALAEQGHGEQAVREFRALANAAAPGTGRELWRLLALTNVTGQLCLLERFEEAVTDSREVLAEAEALPEAQRALPRLAALNSLTTALTGLGHASEAEAVAREALDEAETTAPAASNFQSVLRVTLASALSAQHRHSEALEVLADAVTRNDPTGTHGATSAIAKAQAVALLGLGRPEEAVRAARTGLAAALQAFDEPHARIRELRALLARAEGAAG